MNRLQGVVRMVKRQLTSEVISCSKKCFTTKTAENLITLSSKEEDETALKRDQVYTDADQTDEPNVPCYVEDPDGFIRVIPYHFMHKTWAKQRWIGKSLEEVYQAEFLEHPASYYRAAIKLGKITVNGKKVTPAYKIRESDLLQHKAHRHEPPVLSTPKIQKLWEDDEIVVIDKPSSYQVHPTGRYFYNTIIERLKYDYGYEYLGICNRLDKLTSGIMIIGKNKNKTQQLSMQMTNRAIKKEYIAKVEGEFEFSKIKTFPNDTEIVSDTSIKCNAPVGIVSHKLSIYSAYGRDAKLSSTIFEFISYCATSNTSIIRCIPLTGRTHQIRVHLRYLGFPICNDLLYNNSLWKSVCKQNEGLCISKITESVCDQLLNIIARDNSQPANPVKLTNDLQSLEKGEQSTNLNNNYSDIPNELSDIITSHPFHLDNFDFDNSPCYQCKHPPKEPKKDSLYICLHAYKYQLENGQTFQTALPHWVK